MNSNILCEGSSDFIDETEDNQKAIRKMVMDSYCDIGQEESRDYEEFFAELEQRYRDEGRDSR